MAKPLYNRPKQYACFTKEQQEFFEKLPKRQQQYIEFRGQGYDKAKSYTMAGYEGKTSNQAAYMLEKRNKGITECINAILNEKKAKEIMNKESRGSQQIDALAMQKKAEDVLAKIDGMDGEEARRIIFYRSIIEGKIKTVRKTIKKNGLGETIEVKIEEVCDIDNRIKARKELDRLLGLNAVIDVGSMQVGDITINIVDASKKEELADERNTVNLDMDKVEELDGEQVIVVEEKEEDAKTPKQEAEDEDLPSEADKFFESVGEENGRSE